MEITINNLELAVELESMMEGMMEVLEDDGNEDGANYMDLESVADKLRELKAYPATIVVGDAERVMLLATAENCRDNVEEPDELLQLEQLITALKAE